MKKLIICSKFEVLVEYNLQLIEKYFSLENFTVVSYNKLDIKVPNIVIKTPMSKYWTNGLIDFFEGLVDHSFFMMMEDHFLFDYVDTDLFDYGSKQVSTGKATKFLCSARLNRGNFTQEYNEDWYKCPKQEHPSTRLIPVSLMPSVWNTKFFKHILARSKIIIIWDFEVKNYIGILKDVDSNIIYHKTKEVFQVSHLRANNL